MAASFDQNIRFQEVNESQYFGVDENNADIKFFGIFLLEIIMPDYHMISTTN